jgi:cytochrome d ubiquinol oxidase subunit II
MIKCEGKLFDNALRWGRRALPLMGLALFAVSVSTPLVSSTIAARWFSLPNLIGLAPIPISTAIAFGVVSWVLDRLTVWDAAAAPGSLKFVLIGVAIVIPFTLGYTVFVYRVFHGKASKLTYGG